ncbi:hypothetical protein D3C72_953240 [compost metagenome]
MAAQTVRDTRYHGRERPGKCTEVTRQIDTAVIKRIAQRQHRLHVAGDAQITRKEQRIGILPPLHQRKQHEKRSLDRRVRLGQAALSADGDGRTCGFDHEGEGEIDRQKSVALVAMFAEPDEHIRMPLHDLRQHRRRRSLHHGNRQKIQGGGDGGGKRSHEGSCRLCCGRQPNRGVRMAV